MLLRGLQSRTVTLEPQEPKKTTGNRSSWVWWFIPARELVLHFPNQAALASETDKAQQLEASTINSRKRKRSIDKLASPVHKQPHIVKPSGGGGVQKMIGGYDDELSCPM